MKTPRMTIQITNADGLMRNTEPAILVLTISRREVQELNFTSSLERLLVLIDTPENIRLYRDSLIFEVQGFETDKRELPEIPEVRKFFAQLTAAWPHWLWFVSRDSGSLSLLLACLCPVKVHRAQGRFGTEFVDLDALQSVLEDMYVRGSAICSSKGVTRGDYERSVESALEFLGLIE